MRHLVVGQAGRTEQGGGNSTSYILSWLYLPSICQGGGN